MWIRGLLWLLAFTAITGEDADISETITTVSMNLLKAVMDDNRENTMFSPVGVSMLLSILQQGALGQTLQQLNEVLHVDAEQSRKIYGKLVHNIKKTSNSSTIIEFATKAFINRGFEIQLPFKKTLVNEFDSDIEKLQFSDANSAAQQINSWVDKQTHGRVNQIVAEDNLDANVQLLLANALFFKGSWLSPFKPNKTRDRQFKLDNGEEVSVPTMHRAEFLKAGEMPSFGFKWIELPFQGKQFVMYVILPNEGKTVNSLVKHLATTDTFATLLKSKRRINVNIALPKFKLSSFMDLVKPLEQIGVYDIFSQEKSNLKGISEKPLYVSQILHRATLSIDEKGGTAASSTGVVVRLRSALELPLDIMEFIVNRPFLVFIVDKENNMPLFAGRITDPSKS